VSVRILGERKIVP